MKNYGQTPVLVTQLSFSGFRGLYPFDTINFEPA